MSPLRLVLYSLACSLPLLVPIARGEPAGPRTDSKPRMDRHGDPLPSGASARLGSIPFRTGGAHIDLLHFSPDGQTLSSLDTTGQVRAWRVDSGKEQRHCQLPGFSRWDLTADGRVLVAQLFQNDIRIVATATGNTIREVATISGNRLYPFYLAPNGKRLAAVATHNNNPEQVSFRIWSLPDGQEPRAIPVAARHGEKAVSVEADALSFVADGKILIARLLDEGKYVFRRWDTATGRELPATPHHYQWSRTLFYRRMASTWPSASKTITKRLLSAWWMWPAGTCADNSLRR